MAEAREKAAWNHTSALMALTFNMWRDPKKTRPREAADFHPYMARGKEGVPINKGNIRILKKVFLEGRTDR